MPNNVLPNRTLFGNAAGRVLALVLLLSAGLFGATASPASAAPLAYSSNTNIYLSTPQITLVIQAASVADGLTINAASVAVTLSAGETATLTSPQAMSYSVAGSGGGLSQTCVTGTQTETVSQSSGSETYTLTPTGSACVSHAAGSGGGGSYVPAPSVSLSVPNGGATYNSGQQVGISWSSANGGFTVFRISYSSDDGNSWTVLSSVVSGSGYSWIVPTVSTSQGLIKVEGLDASGNVLASDVSASVFSIHGTTVTPPAVTPPVTTTAPRAVDSTVSGTYVVATAKANNPDFNTDMNLPTVTSSPCVSGTLIKGSLPAVYYCGADGKRYVFVNEQAYLSWYADFSTVKAISDAVLASISLGGNVTYRPGARLVKIQTDPKVYAVARGGVLRWVMTEAIAARLYGASWNKIIDDIPDAFFVNYTVGEPIGQ